MSTILLNTPDSSSRDSSAISTPAIMPNVVANHNNNNNADDESISKTSNANNNNTGSTPGGPPSPRASDTAIVVPRRIFVGGFPPSTTETELRVYFEQFGSVKDVKIIRDHSANAKGKYSYGFITFETDEEAKKLIALGKTEGTRAFEFRGRYLNVNEAVKKPPFNKLLPLDSVPPTGVVLRDAYGQLFTIQNGYAVIASPDSYAVAQPQPLTPSFPFFVQHPVYFASTAPPAPIKYAHQTNTSYDQIPPTPVSAPVIPHNPHSNVPPNMQKGRFVFPPVTGYPPFNGNQMAHLPPTPLASPVNPESPSKNPGTNFTGNNPAINNLTNPFPTVIGSTGQQLPPSPYRWATSTMTGPVTQLVYPGGYPTFVHDANHGYPMQAPMQQQTATGTAQGFYSSENTDSMQETGYGGRRKPKTSYRAETGARLKDC